MRTFKLVLMIPVASLLQDFSARTLHVSLAIYIFSKFVCKDFVRLNVNHGRVLILSKTVCSQIGNLFESSYCTSRRARNSKVEIKKRANCRLHTAGASKTTYSHITSQKVQFRPNENESGALEASKLSKVSRTKKQE